MKKLLRTIHSAVPLSVFSYKNHFYLLSKRVFLGRETLHITSSKDGASFHGRPRAAHLLVKDIDEDLSACSQFRITALDKGFFMTYTKKTPSTKKSTEKVATHIAYSEDASTWHHIGILHAGDSSAVALPYKHEPHVAHTTGSKKPLLKHRTPYRAYTLGTFLHLAESKSLGETWHTVPKLLMTKRHGFFDAGHLTLCGTGKTPWGILTLYDASTLDGDNVHLRIGAILTDEKDPSTVVWRARHPFYDQLIIGKTEKPTILGATFTATMAYVFWHFNDGSTFVCKVPISQHVPLHREQREKIVAPLTRHHGNPILAPLEEHEWENEGVFNPAALYDDGKVHILYRALGKAGISVLGYASSPDGLNFTKRSDTPAYIPRADFEGTRTAPSQYTDLYQSGGGWGGCEDPKLTRIGDRIYLTYVAYDGWRPPRVALSSISRADFLAQHWNWTMPILISEPNVVNKSGCILPEKVDGKYVIFHRVFPDILIDCVDDLNFEQSWLKAKYKIRTRPLGWDSRKLSVGATPLKTPYGWLTIYHAVDDKDDTRYKMGAMILDLKEPHKVIARTNHPILVPETHYENDGKPGVVYPCGAAIIDGTLYVYYGGGDKVVCVATADLDTFLREVLEHKTVHLEPRQFSM